VNEKNAIAPIEDVLGATQLVYENEKAGPLFDRIFGMDNTVSLVNFGCVGENDRVLVISQEAASILGPLSYTCLPKQLVSLEINTDRKHWGSDLRDKRRWNAVKELLSGYICINPDFQSTALEDIQYGSGYFNVCIAEDINQGENSSAGPRGRFTLETGPEYENFEKLLVKGGDLLVNGGRLLILSKPGWILKCWELIDKLGLQLEYENYRIYTEETNHPNVYVWLRFTKRADNFNLESHKRNILALMKDNNIDRLFAHRNKLIFPYVELSYSNAESYVQLEQNLQNLQYFFSLETTKNLAQLCEGYTACLVTPSIAQYAHENNKNVVLFEMDNRFRQNRGLKFVKYDLNTGLTKLTKSKYGGKFDRVICDPPFDINLDYLARDIEELLGDRKECTAYVVFPQDRSISLKNSMELRGFTYHGDVSDILIEYSKPPKLVRLQGKQAIQLYKFVRDKGTSKNY